LKQRGATAFTGGRVWTADKATAGATAVLVTGGRITRVGSAGEVRAAAPPGTEFIDLRGRMLLPGFIDSHNHLRLGGDPGILELNDATTLDSIHARIAEWLDRNPGAEWIEATGFNYAAIPGGRSPTWRDLEPATRGIPAFVLSYDAHTAWLNAEALARFGITRGSPHLPWGTPETDPSGEPTGFVRDFAVRGISPAGQRALAAVLPSYAPGRQLARLRRALAMAARYGITTVVEPQNGLEDLPLLARARGAGPIAPRLIAALFVPPGERPDLGSFDEARHAYDDDWFRASNVKLYADDVIEPHTAALLDPYANRPGWRGSLFWDPAELAGIVQRLDARGYRVFIHATGDRGIRTALDAIEHAQQANCTGTRRHQIVHVECLHPADLPRFAALRVVACMQPRHCAPDITTEWRANVGPSRWPLAWAFRSLHDAGAPLAFSSDWNVAEMDPLAGIYTALTRATPDGTRSWVPQQRLDLETTLRAYTIGGAWANGNEHTRGSITPGKDADLVVLSRDLFTLTHNPRQILSVRADLTMVGGQVIHQAGEQGDIAAKH
jgi:predicted amidohydrolase YtcJ